MTKKDIIPVHSPIFNGIGPRNVCSVLIHCEIFIKFNVAYLLYILWYFIGKLTVNMATFLHVCNDSSETQDLFEPQGLYLKPIAKLSISVQLPQLKIPGKSISSWEVMEKIKNCIKPDQFTVLKVSKSTLEFIRFEGETESRTQMKAIMSRLDNKTIKLSGFPDVLKIRTAEAKINFPTRHDWDSYFRDAKNMNEMKSGERPDTIYFQMLPCKWFANKKGGDPDKPSEYILKKVFETFGEVRSVDIPMLDPYRREMTRNSGTIQTFSFGQDLTFEAYVQYKEYIGFVKAMTALRGMKLIYKSDDGNCFAAYVKVDFDRSKHLSEKNIRKRRQEREKLIQLEQEKEERVRREREEEEKKKEDERKRQEEEEKQREQKREEKLRKREEKRKQRQLERQKIAEEKRLTEIRKLEERAKFLKTRKIEAMRLLTALIDKVKVVKQKEEIRRRMEVFEKERLNNLRDMHKKKEENQRKRTRSWETLSDQTAHTHSKLQNSEDCQTNRLVKQEQLLRERLIHNLELKKEQNREKLRRELSGRTKLRSVLVMKNDCESVLREHNSPKLKSVLVTQK